MNINKNFGSVISIFGDFSSGSRIGVRIRFGSTDRTVFENHRKGIIQQFNNASEASYVYILRGQKLIKNAKNGPFWRVFENMKLAVSNSDTRQVNFNRK